MRLNRQIKHNRVLFGMVIGEINDIIWTNDFNLMETRLYRAIRSIIKD